MENQSSAEIGNAEVDHHGGRRSDEFQQTTEIVTLQAFSELFESQPKKWYSGYSWQRRPQIHKVPAQVRLRRPQSERIYHPTVVSLGPYHHGKQELREAEEFKHICLDWCARSNQERKGFFYNKIFEKIQGIRDCYAEVSIVEKYDDKALALMMLLDACFVINFMHNCLDMMGNNDAYWKICLGVASGACIIFDMMLRRGTVYEGILS